MEKNSSHPVKNLVILREKDIFITGHTGFKELVIIHYKY